MRSTITKIAGLLLRLIMVFVLCSGASVVLVTGIIACGDIETAFAIDESNVDPKTGKPLEEGQTPEGSGKHYMDINPLVSTDENGDLKTGFKATDIIDKVIAPIITGVALPVAILMVAWRSIYIAIFPMLARVDPLDMLSTARYTNAGGRSVGRAMSGGRGGKPSQDDATKAFKQEFKGTVIGLVVVMSVWGLLQIAMWVAVMLLGYGEKTDYYSEGVWFVLLPLTQWVQTRLAIKTAGETSLSETEK